MATPEQKPPTTEADKPPEDESQQKWRMATQIAISATALAFLVLHSRFPSFATDKTGLALVVIAFLPWLGLVFKSLEITGLGKIEFLQREIKNIKAEVGAVKDETRANTEKSSFASGAAARVVSGAGDSAESKKILLDLAKKYAELRDQMPRGWKRTAEFTRLFGQMTAAAAGVQDFDVKDYLSSSNEGNHLAGLAYLFAKPRADMLDRLIDSIAQEKRAAFNQYWGLKTIEHILESGGRLSPQDSDRLRGYMKGLTSNDRDRYRLAEDILRRFQA